MTNTSEKYERTQQGNLLGAFRIDSLDSLVNAIYKKEEKNAHQECALPSGPTKFLPTDSKVVKEDV